MEQESEQRYKRCEHPGCERSPTADERCLVHERRDGKSAEELADAGLLKRGVSLAEAHLVKADLSGAGLSEADLWMADLSEADLSEADLSGANFWRADLLEADISDEDFLERVQADLSEADLSGANLSEANLSEADLSEAYLRRAALFEANIFEANLSEADLSGADLSWADLSEANFFGADLSGANLFFADLSKANLSNADLSEADLSEANLSRANLSQASHPTSLIDADLTNTEFADADLSGVDLLAPDEADSERERERRLSSLPNLLRALLRSDDAPTVVRGLQAVGEISEARPEVCANVVTETHRAVAATDSTVGRVSGVRALATVALETETTVEEADETFADCLRDPDSYLREETIAAVGPVVGDRPSGYPETIRALQACTTEGSPVEAVMALQTLVVVAASHSQEVPIQRLQSAVDDLEDNPTVPAEAVDELQTALRGVSQ